MRAKHLKKGEYRVIQIDRSAVMEALSEYVMEYQEALFDVLSYADLEIYFMLDDPDDICTFIAYNCGYHADFHELHTEELHKTIGATTNSLLAAGRKYQTIWYPSDNARSGYGGTKVKRLREGEYRIIQIDRYAVFEVLVKFISEHYQSFFDVSSCKDLEIHFKFDDPHDICTCVAFNSKYRKEFEKLDVDEIHKTIGITTKSLFYPGCRYKTLYQSDGNFSEGSV